MADSEFYSTNVYTHLRNTEIVDQTSLLPDFSLTSGSVFPWHFDAVWKLEVMRHGMALHWTLCLADSCDEPRCWN